MAEKKPKPKKEKVVLMEVPKDVYTAVFDFKKLNIVIPRRGEGKSDKGKTYMYATLDDIMANISMPLIERELLVTQPINAGLLETIIRHVPSGTEMRSSLDLGKPSNPQDLGARITYFRRYMISSILGLATEEDTDAKPVATNEKPEGVKMPTPEMPVSKHDEAMTEVLGKVLNTETEVKTNRSPSYQKASQAILSCENPAALEALQRAIDASVRLNDGEKADLKVELDAKMNEIEPTIKRD